jgi:hypothetical protein
MIYYDKAVSSISGIQLNSIDSIYAKTLNVNGDINTNNTIIVGTGLFMNLNLTGSMIFNSGSSLLSEQLTTNDLLVNNTIIELEINTLTNQSCICDLLITDSLEIDDLIVNNSILTLTINDLIVNNVITSLSVENLTIGNSFVLSTDIISITNIPLTINSIPSISNMILTLRKIGGLYQLSFQGEITADASPYLIGVIPNIGHYPSFDEIFSLQQFDPSDVIQNINMTINSTNGEITITGDGIIITPIVYGCTIVYMRNNPI